MDKSKLIQPDEVNDNTPFLFVSYSRKDIEEVQEIMEILRRNHFRFWYDMGLRSGAEWAEALGEKIEQCSQFMVIVTENSMQSKYVRKEINMAVDMKNDGQILVLYMCNLILPNGLKLLLGDLQAVLRYVYLDERDFEEAICHSISNEILYSVALEDDNFIERAKRATENDFLSARMNTLFAAEDALMSNYVIDYKIGQGGVAVVYRGHHKRTGVSVAIKRGTLDTTYRGDLLREVYKNELWILKKLSNTCQNIPYVLDWFEDETNVFLVSSYIEGASLANIVREYTESQIIEILRKLLDILKNIHRHGIIYKDIKPANVIEDENGSLFLIDFNTAWDTKEELDSEKIVWTRGYSPPEQMSIDRREHTDFSSDIYALGRLVENLLLRDKFDRSGNRIPLRVYRKDISVEFENIVMKMTEPDRKNRFQSTEEVLLALKNYQQDGLIKKIKLHFFSKRRSRDYCAERQSIAQKHVADMKEMADMTEIVDL